MNQEIKKISICAVIGTVIGLIFGISSGDFIIIVFMPIIFTIYIIGVAYGFQWIVKLLLPSLKITGRGLMASIFNIGNDRFQWGAILQIMFGCFLLSLITILGWIPGILIAIKALWNAKNGSHNSSPKSSDDGWGDENFDSPSKPPPKKTRKESSRRSDKNFDGDDWDW